MGILESTTRWTFENLNMNLNTAYEKVKLQSKNLNVEREKLNDENTNSDVKQQMYDKMRKVECKMKHSILAGMERHIKPTTLIN